MGKMQDYRHFQNQTFKDVTAKRQQEIGTIHSKRLEIWQPGTT